MGVEAVDSLLSGISKVLCRSLRAPREGHRSILPKADALPQPRSNSYKLICRVRRGSSVDPDHSKLPVRGYVDTFIQIYGTKVPIQSELLRMLNEPPQTEVCRTHSVLSIKSTYDCANASPDRLWESEFQFLTRSTRGGAHVTTDDARGTAAAFLSNGLAGAYVLLN